MSTRWIRRATALGLVLASGATAVPALGHAPVIGTSPANGATVSPIGSVSVRFGAAVVTGTMSVSRSTGSAVATRTVGLDPRNRARLRATFARKLTSGRYTVSWRARATDGHSERGTFSFRVR
ncbi:MAG: CopC domain [Solirubrobacteraceae bacterium]|jgi:methionine-rich copper-binding protein CopC|nr:CopC domain [Solirubrobacteraceae bacterium]